MMKLFKKLLEWLGITRSEPHELEPIDLKSLFADANQLCLGMTWQDYGFAEFYANLLKERVTPEEAVDTIVEAVEEIIRSKDKELTELSAHYSYSPGDMRYLVQFIDAVAEPEFANAVRLRCEQFFGWKIARNVKVPSKNYPVLVEYAVDWWCGALQRRLLKPGKGNSDRLIYRNFSEKEIHIFRKVLSAQIADELYYNATAKFSNGLLPDPKLIKATRAIGIDELHASSFFLPETFMYITPRGVIVEDHGRTVGTKAGLETLANEGVMNRTEPKGLLHG